MATMTITITNVPTFAVVNTGYQFTGTVNIPQTVQAPIRINSMSLYYGRGRTYRVGPYLKVKCGDTEFRTDYFTISETGESSAKERTLNIIGAITVGDDHLLKVNGRTITFTAAHDSSSGKLIDRPYAGNMTLTVNYEVLFTKSEYTVPDAADMGTDLVLTVAGNELNAGYAHRAELSLGGLTVTGSRTGPGEIALRIPRTEEWLAMIPDAVQKTGTVTLTTEGAGQTATESKPLIITVPEDVKPAITAAGVYRIDGRVPEAWDLWVQGESAAQVRIDEAEPGTGSSIAGYRIEGEGFAANDRQLTTGKILMTGYQRFTLTATDARGRTGQETFEIYVNGYAAPTISDLDAVRASDTGAASDSGTKIKGSARYGLTEIGANAPEFRVIAGGVETVPESLTAEDGLLNFLLSGPYDLAHSVEVTVEIRDGITAGSENPGSLTDLVPTANVAMNIKRGGTAAAFGRYAETDKTLAIPEDWRFIRGEVDIERKADEALTKAEEAYEKAEEAVNADGGDADTLGGKFPAYYLTPVNVLDNGDFTNPINQRGGTSYTAEGYTIDRWRLWGSGNAVTVNEGYVSVTGAMQQYLETYDPEMTYTLAACNTTGEIFCVSGTFGDEAAKADWGEMAYSANYSLANVALRSGNWVWVAVYEGEFTAEMLPPYVPKGYNAELHKCQRYAYAPPNKATMLYPGYTYSTTVGYFTIKTPVPMRELPTLTVETVGNVQVFYGTNTKACTNAYAYSIDNDAVSIRVASSGMPNPGCINCRFNTPAFLDCELA